jgi:hypothetical protein
MGCVAIVIATGAGGESGVEHAAPTVAITEPGGLGSIPKPKPSAATARKPQPSAATAYPEPRFLCTSAWHRV